MGPNLPKNYFWGGNFKNLSLDSESAPLTYWEHQFQTKRLILNFGPKFAQKWILGSEIQKSKSRLGINTSNKSCVPIFSQNGHFLIFGLNLGKSPNCVQYFGSNVVAGFAESWVETGMSWLEVEMSWVEVDGAGWRWVHGLVIPFLELCPLNKCFEVKSILK